MRHLIFGGIYAMVLSCFVSVANVVDAGGDASVVYG